MDKKNIAIAYTFDESRWKTAIVSITSLLDNRGDFHYDVYCVVPPKLAGNKKILAQMQDIVKKIDSKSSLKFVAYDYKNAGIDFTENMAFGGGIIYYKMDFWSLLPALDRVIYLDDDTIVLRPLNDLADENLGDNYLMIFSPGRSFVRNKNKYKDYQPVNAGVLVFNLKAIRKSDTPKTFRALEKNKDLSFEQGLLSMAFHKHIKVFDNTHVLYNMRTHSDWPRGKEVAIIHYTMKKPWFHLTRYFRTWWKYAKMTPFYFEFKKNWLHNFWTSLWVMFIPNKVMRHKLRKQRLRLS